MKKDIIKVYIMCLFSFYLFVRHFCLLSFSCARMCIPLYPPRTFSFSLPFSANSYYSLINDLCNPIPVVLILYVPSPLYTSLCLLGHCLCSQGGCDSTCRGYPNVLFQNPLSHHIVSSQHIANWRQGIQYIVNDQVPLFLFSLFLSHTHTFSSAINYVGNDQVVILPREESDNENTPYLWRGGTRGGRARIVKWGW